MRAYEMVILASSGGMCSMHWRVENCIRSIDGEGRWEENTCKTRGWYWNKWVLVFKRMKTLWTAVRQFGLRTAGGLL
jgi:hypothetical protein